MEYWGAVSDLKVASGHFMMESSSVELVTRAEMLETFCKQGGGVGAFSRRYQISFLPRTSLNYSLIRWTFSYAINVVWKKTNLCSFSKSMFVLFHLEILKIKWKVLWAPSTTLNISGAWSIQIPSLIRLFKSMSLCHLKSSKKNVFKVFTERILSQWLEMISQVILISLMCQYILKLCQYSWIIDKIDTDAFYMFFRWRLWICLHFIYLNKVYTFIGALLLTYITHYIPNKKYYLRFCPAVSSCDFQLSKRWEGEHRSSSWLSVRLLRRLKKVIRSKLKWICFTLKQD